MHHYPFHVGDYISSTAHLTIEEDCAYRRLLDLYYQTEKPIQSNHIVVARLIRMKGLEDVVISILNEFFVYDVDSDDFHHSRCDEELLKFKAMKDGGRNGAAKRWAKESNADAIPPLSPPHATPNGEAYSNQEPRTKNQEPYIADAKIVIEYLNTKAGRNFKPVDANMKLIVARLKEGATVDELKQVVDSRVSLWSADPKMSAYLRPATLFNAEKYAQYSGELSKPNGQAYDQSEFLRRIGATK